MSAERIRRLLASSASALRDDRNSGSGKENEKTEKLSKALNQLIERVDAFEEEHDSVPESYMKLLEDLRRKVLQLSNNVSSTGGMDGEDWAEEKQYLLAEIDSYRETIDEMRSSFELNSESIRQRYERALRASEEALEQQTNAAKEEINRLQSTIANERNLHAPPTLTSIGIQTLVEDKNQINVFSAPTIMSAKPEEPLQGVLRLQQLLDSTTDDLERCQEQIQIQKRNQEKEIRDLNRSHELILRSTRIELDTLRTALNSGVSGNAYRENGLESDNVESAQEKLRMISRKYEAKRIELEAVQNAIASVSDFPLAGISVPPTNAPPPPPVYKDKFLINEELRPEEFRYQLQANAVIRRELEDKLRLANEEVSSSDSSYVIIIHCVNWTSWTLSRKCKKAKMYPCLPILCLVLKRQKVITIIHILHVSISKLISYNFMICRLW
jgi:hypothetical protein